MFIHSRHMEIGLIVITAPLLVLADGMLAFYQVDPQNAGPRLEMLVLTMLPILTMIGFLWMSLIPYIHWKWTCGYLICGCMHIGIYYKIIAATPPGDIGPIFVGLHWYIWIAMFATGCLSWGISAAVKYGYRWIKNRREMATD